MIFLIVSVFILSYICISLETYIHIHKAAVALVSGVLCWAIYILFTDDKNTVIQQLDERLGALAGILFFLLSAMTVVELIDVHGGFDIITKQINQTKPVSGLYYGLSP